MKNIIFFQVLLSGALIATSGWAKTIAIESFVFSLEDRWELKKEIRDQDRIALAFNIDGEHLQINVQYVDDRDPSEIIPNAQWQPVPNLPFKIFTTSGAIKSLQTHGFFVERKGIRYLGFITVEPDKKHLFSKIIDNLTLKEME